MGANIIRPFRGERVEAPVITSEQGSRGLLKADTIPCQYGHDAVGGIASPSRTLLGIDTLAGVVNQSPERRRRAAGLERQPRPVPWQQRDLTALDAEPRPPWPFRRFPRLHAFEDVVQRAPKIEVDLTARLILEDQQRRASIVGMAELDGREHIDKGTAMNKALGGERRV